MKLGGLLSLLLAACAMLADAAIRNLKELESAVGDNAPRSVLDGVLAFLNEPESDGVTLKLFGNESYRK